MTFKNLLLGTVATVCLTTQLASHASAQAAAYQFGLPYPQYAKECGNPPRVATFDKIFYVDPVKGSVKGDGSAANPFRTLAEVMDPARKLVQYYDKSGKLVNPKAPITARSVLMLASGDHGKVQMNGMFMKDFLLVTNAVGAKPVLRGLLVYGGSRMIFNGLTVLAPEGALPKGESDFMINLAGNYPYFGTLEHVYFMRNKVATVENSDAWSDSDWVKKAFAGLSISGNCNYAHQNEFTNINNTLLLRGSNQSITQNKIYRFGNDGIMFQGENLTINANTITDGRHTKLNPSHADAMQGFIDVPSKNITITDNTIAQFGDPERHYLQGISAFDGTWENVVLMNNIVLTNTWHGISFFGAKNIKILNNTVLASFKPEKTSSWIQIREGRLGRPTEDAVVRNNIATVIDVKALKTKVENNTALIDMKIDGKYYAKDGMAIPGNNTIVKDPAKVFVKPADTSSGMASTYNLRPLVTRIAGYLKGDLPSYDGQGKRRDTTAPAAGALIPE